MSARRKTTSSGKDETSKYLTFQERVWREAFLAAIAVKDPAPNLAADRALGEFRRRFFLGTGGRILVCEDLAALTAVEGDVERSVRVGLCCLTPELLQRVVTAKRTPSKRRSRGNSDGSPGTSGYNSFGG